MTRRPALPYVGSRIRTARALCEAVGMEPSYALRPTACRQCGDEPPPGFTCDACGAPRGSAGSS